MIKFINKNKLSLGFFASLERKKDLNLLFSFHRASFLFIFARKGEYRIDLVRCTSSQGCHTVSFSSLSALLDLESVFGK